MILGKDQADKVIGEIYKITNTETNKCYIGQTRSHRLNHNKYRPFGYLGRFKDHINEAHSNKKNQSWYLNASLLKYGSECFVCELITTCQISELNSYESQFILQYNSKYPNGYNLTDGGQSFSSLADRFETNMHKSVIANETTTVFTRPKNVIRSDYTKQLISKQLKTSLSDPNHRKEMMKIVQNQHTAKKFSKYINVSVDESKIEDYISIIHDNKSNTDYIRVSINGIRSSFVGKYDSINDIKQRARVFILQLVNWQRDQIAGNPLEPSLPLTLGNICEELG